MVTSINQPTTTDTTATATATDLVQTDTPNSVQPDDPTRMSVDIDTTSASSNPSSSSPLAPLSPTISLSRPFHPAQAGLLPALASTSASTLTPITLPSAVPASRPLNGRTWRNLTQQPTRSLTHTHHPNNTKAWATHQSTRQHRLLLRVKATEMEELAKGVRLEERRKREQRSKMKVENEKKNRIVQVIKDSSKIKRMSRAQLKLIEKA